jgi:hypothetical protein
LDKQGLNLKSIEKRTGARVQIPCMKNSSDIIYITGTKDSTKKSSSSMYQKYVLMNRNLNLTRLSKLIFEKNDWNE